MNNLSSHKFLSVAAALWQARFTQGVAIGLGAFLVERSFFPENERNDQERPHRSEKKKRLERVLKNIGTFSKRTERELLEKNG